MIGEWVIIGLAVLAACGYLGRRWWRKARAFKSSASKSCCGGQSSSSSRATSVRLTLGGRNLR